MTTKTLHNQVFKQSTTLVIVVVLFVLRGIFSMLKFSQVKQRNKKMDDINPQNQVPQPAPLPPQEPQVQQPQMQPQAPVESQPQMQQPMQQQAPVQPQVTQQQPMQQPMQQPVFGSTPGINQAGFDKAAPGITLGVLSIVIGLIIPLVGIILGVIAIIKGYGKPGNSTLGILGIVGNVTSILAIFFWLSMA